MSVLGATLTVSVWGTAELRLCICADRPQADLTWLPFFRYQGQGDP